MFCIAMQKGRVLFVNDKRPNLLATTRKLQERISRL